MKTGLFKWSEFILLGLGTFLLWISILSVDENTCKNLIMWSALPVKNDRCTCQIPIYHIGTNETRCTSRPQYKIRMSFQPESHDAGEN